MRSDEALEVENETPGKLVALALERQASPETLSKLLDLQERWEAGEARKKYVMAMTAFKQDAPAVLKKTDRVDFSTAKGRTAYNYANLGSIVQEITAVMGKHDLSASWSTAQNGNDVTVTCHITHAAGHRESVTLTGPVDDSGNKNRIQAVGSTVTYLERYTLLAALGLATGEDDDGRQGAGAGEPPGGHINPPKEKAPSTNGDRVQDKLATELAAYCDQDLDKMQELLKGLTLFDGKDKEGNPEQKWMLVAQISKVSDKWATQTLGKLHDLIKKEEERNANHS